MSFLVTKTYSSERGFSCCFRQWRSVHSHCSKLHGYALSFEVTFGCNELDTRNWVVDFGSMDTFKAALEYMFDHTTIIAEDDPVKEIFKNLHEKGILDLRIIPNVGCEQTAKYVFDMAEEWLKEYKFNEGRLLWVESVRVSEHPGNSATFTRNNLSPFVQVGRLS